MIRILIADDHAIVRQGLRQIVADVPDMVIADEASNGPDALSKALKNDYDAVLLDITMPGRSGLDVLSELKAIKPGMRIIILSIHPEEQYAVRALRAGASAYLTKETLPEELLVAIRKVSTGGKYVSSSLAEKLADELGAGVEKPLHETLSNREYELMCMIVSGKPAKQIADELFLSPKTVSTYRSRILRKMKMKSNAELIRYAIESRLLP